MPLRAEEERVEKVQEEDTIELRPMRSEDQEKNEEETDKVYNLVPFRIFSTKVIAFHCNDIHTRYFEVLENQCFVEIKSRTVDSDGGGPEPELNLSQATSDTLRKHGININTETSADHADLVTKKCKENEIFLMNKNKMFLVSSEKIVHDISGDLLAQ